MNLNKGLLSTPYRSDKAQVECHFRNLQQVLLSEIEKADIVLGCVAWISDPLILESLTKRSTALILDSKINRMGKRLQALYAQLQHTDKQPIYDMLLNGLGSERYLCYTDTENEPVKGAYAEDWNFESGLYAVDGFYQYMHHKFLVLIKEINPCNQCGKKMYQPTVWTGSFNFTKNASKGLENAVIIRDRFISASYLCEFLEIYRNHSRQVNILDLEDMDKGIKANGENGVFQPRTYRGEQFPLEWFCVCCLDWQTINCP
jgi:phosphatidylserine/phosphatidylglycerophosphate/cardiolipin synthase-like enzyme